METANFKTISDTNKNLFKQNNDLNNHIKGLKEQNNKLNNYNIGAEKIFRDKIAELKEQIHFLNKQKSENKSHLIDLDDINNNANKRIKIEDLTSSGFNYTSNSNVHNLDQSQRRLLKGPRGGVYCITQNGDKRYVDRSLYNSN